MRARPDPSADPPWVKRSARKQEAGPDGSVTGPDGSVTGAPGPAQDQDPGPQRSGRRRGGSRDAGGGAGWLWSVLSASPDAGAPDTGAPGAEPHGAGPSSDAPPWLRTADSADTGRQGAGPRGPAPEASPQGAGTGGSGHTNPIDRLFGHVPGKRGADGTETFTASVGRLAREHVRETVAILLLGLGGLILPYPFWPIGADAAMFSRLRDVKDKLLAFAGPLLVTLAISVLVALFVGGHGRNVIEIYFHAVHLGFGLLIRVGSVITAAYLAWRVSQGPRFKVPPWRHQRR